MQITKLLALIRNNKTKVKKTIGMLTVAVELKYSKINSVPASL